MSHEIRRLILVAMICTFFTLLAYPLRAQDTAQTASAIADVKSRLNEVEGDIIKITEKIPKKDEKPDRPVGPPSKEKIIMDEARERLEWLKATRDQMQESIRRAEQATNPAETQVYLKDARLKADTAATISQSITGAAPSQQPTGAATGTASGSSSRLHFNSGALQQLEISAQRSTEAAQQRNPEQAQERSNRAFGSGRAGAGGVALYKAATITTPLDPSKMSGAQVENGRLVLVYSGKKLQFPPLDLQFLALAIRSVYGGEGLVKGTLRANENNAVVLSTSKEQYGEVVWKKEFLPDLPKNLTVGENMALDLGPGVGALSLPDPSYGRITYYGPLKGTILGQVLQESDMVFSMFWYGVHWKTGLPLEPLKLQGYESAIDIDLRQPPHQKQTTNSEKPKNWWEETVWFIWTPGEISLQLSSKRPEFEFVKAMMKVTVWGVREENVSAASRAQGEYLTENFDNFAKAFPVLAQLREAAKAVAVVRWLKQNNVAMSVEWAKSYPLATVDTLEKYRRFSVTIERDDNGKPLVVTETSQ